MKNKIRCCALLFAAALLPASPAASREAPAVPGLDLSALYTADLVGIVDGGLEEGVRATDNLEVAVDADLSELAGWKGARARIHLLSNRSGRPNELAGTIQGINNIEVDEDRSKLYQLWIEQSFAEERVRLLLGLADLNAEFYQNEAASLLIGPAFGIGSELAATGPNGPSIFPSTALTARLRVAVGKDGYVQAATVNAKAGVLGDPDGIDVRMKDGLLLIGEAGWTRTGKLAAGFWRYTKRQPRFLLSEGEHDRRGEIAQGGYILVEQPISIGRAEPLHLFARVGFSDGETTPFRGGWQIGGLWPAPIAGRPDGQFAFGINRGLLTSDYHLLVSEGSATGGEDEVGFELTYSDLVAPFMTLQPDIQYIRRPGGDPRTKDALVLSLRVRLTLP